MKLHVNRQTLTSTAVSPENDRNNNNPGVCKQLLAVHPRHVVNQLPGCII